MESSRARSLDCPKLYDLHVHTKWSKDSMADPKLVVRVSVKKGLSGIAITDHNHIIGAYEAKRYAPEGFDVIIGEEIKTKQGDVIGLNISERIRPRIDVDEAIDQIREQGGLVLLPHPFSVFRRRISKSILRIVNKVDLVEVVNGRSFSFDNLLSKKLAEEANKPGVGGSDAHFYFEIGSVSVDLSRGLHNPGSIVEKRFRFKIIPLVLSGIVNLAKHRKILLKDHLGTIEPSLRTMIFVSENGSMWIKNPQAPSKVFRLKMRGDSLLPDEVCVRELKSVSFCLRLDEPQKSIAFGEVNRDLRISVNDLIINSKSKVTHVILDDNSAIPLSKFIQMLRGGLNEV
ncbi:MAG: hypothetical protein DRO00_09845 [Thermoproteota archaeon]|nr:MAG: hypothetical protein DRO00_09845 [Candidatus Korarchaeota archaeon]